MTAEKQNDTGSAFSLTGAEKDTLLAIARRTVDEFVLHGTIPGIDPGSLTPTLRTPCGAFVTLNEHGALRGCIGRFDAANPSTPSYRRWRWPPLRRITGSARWDHRK